MLSRHLRLGVGIAIVAAVGVAGLSAWATSGPPGPRLGVVIREPGLDRGTELRSIDPLGGDGRRLAGHSRNLRFGILSGRPSWSPDGRLAALNCWAGENSPELCVVDAATGRKRLLRHTGTISAPVFMPNGEEIAFAKLVVVSGEFERPASEESLRVKVAVWTIDVEDRSQRRLTRWRRFPEFEPTSFSPDGRLLAGTETLLGGSPRAVAIELQSGRRSIIARNAEEPVYSADGARVAFVREKSVRTDRAADPFQRTIRADLYVATSSGVEPNRIFHHRGAIDSPSWDPSGERLALVRSGPRSPFGRSALVEVNADGSCATTVLAPGKRGGVSGVAWQPGPGREAGRIDC